MAENDYEAVVIGGGAAGLGGALTLARARRRVLVIDGGHPRNAPAAAMHVYPGREGTPPATFLADGRREVTGYGGEIRSGEVVSVDGRAGAFRIDLADGSTVTAGRVLVATGLVDELPDLPGLAGRWGRDVLHCPYCHGWEVRDRAIGVLATSPIAIHQALLWRQWSKNVTVFANDELPGDQEELAARDIPVVTGRVAALEVEDDRLTGVRLEDGRVVACDALAAASRLTARADMLAGLGLEPAEVEMNGHVIGTHIPADPNGLTSVPGVWVAGNVTGLADQVIGAAAAGVRAGAMINADLVAEETRRAVEARR